MKTDPDKVNQLRLAVEETFGRTPGSPTDFNSLSYQILSKTNNKIGVSTLKRFWGYVKSDFNATYTTLSLLARYVGYRDWDSFCTQYKGVDDSDFSSARLITAANLNLNSIIQAEWGSGKWMRIKKTGHQDKFEVIESHNIKLEPGDTTYVSTLIVGEKLIASDCCRRGVSLGTYIGARNGGISSIRIIDKGYDS
ncbi:MAG: hypothetical protein K2H38_09010 [Muribaculaceae bacterium]|nr:hypothetical protein [Muribaculaceae bacterium]